MAHCIAAITSLFTVSVESSVAHYLAHTATERKQLVIVPVPPTTQRLLFQSG
ncbi:Uncharacterised protein [Escherichia coli]|uniref:Uncharacterized protein n=1 Tax=Escherichia coli TaxID=562 RepID=A0A6M4P715_ECOLX|nr:hypothetical protein G6850_00113 [Escherichia coli]QQZ46954.1 hypothetical protein [Escherichia coli]STI65693.1 Uncharacterised protein [Escherichia coli]STI65923.1 Uncharacterised protein [Escherichia coli]